MGGSPCASPFAIFYVEVVRVVGWVCLARSESILMDMVRLLNGYQLVSYRWLQDRQFFVLLLLLILLVLHNTYNFKFI